MGPRLLLASLSVAAGLIALWLLFGRGGGGGARLEAGLAPEADATADAKPGEPIGRGRGAPNRVDGLRAPAGSAPTEEAAQPDGPDPARESPPPVPAGVIEGLVLRGAEPIDGGHVDARAGYHVGLPHDPAARIAALVEGALVRVEIDRGGRFRIGPLAAGWYTLGVDTTATRADDPSFRGGPSAEVDVEVPADAPGARVVIRLGDASLRGHAYDVEGQPIPGAEVSLSSITGGGTQSFATSTDASGAYRLDDLSAESYWISLTVRDADGSESKLAMEKLPRLGPGEARVHDFGAPSRAATWRGRLLHADGTQVTRSAVVALVRAGTGTFEEHSLAAGAELEIRVRPGRYAARARISTSDVGHRTDYIALGEIDVPREDFARDLVLPGTCVRGRLTGIASSELPDGLTLCAYELESTAGPMQVAAVQGDGSFTLHALPAGPYRFTTWPELRVAPGTRLDVREGDLGLACDVPVSPP